MTSSLSSTLSSMEMMLDALMQRGIGKPEEMPKEEAPPVLPSRPTVRGRPPTLHRPGDPAPWMHRPPSTSLLPPPQEEEGEEQEKCSINLELERRAIKAEEAAKQKDDDLRQKNEEIATLRQQVEHYESRVLECALKMKSAEEEMQKQIIVLQMAQNDWARTGGSTTLDHRRELSGGVTTARSLATRAEEASVKRQHRSGDDQPVRGEKQTEVDRLADEFCQESQAFEQGVKAASEAKLSAKSVDELKLLKRQFGAWRKEYETRLHKAKAELKKRVHSEKSHDHGGGHHHGNRRRCSWWRIKAPKCRLPKCGSSIKLPSPSSCCIKLPSPSSCCFKLPRPSSCPCFRRCC